MRKLRRGGREGVETSWTILLAGEMMSMVAQMSQTGLWPSSSLDRALYCPAVCSLPAHSESWLRARSSASSYHKLACYFHDLQPREILRSEFPDKHTRLALRRRQP